MADLTGFSLAARLRAGETIYSGWCSLASPTIVEIAAREGFKAVALDGQHGLWTPQDIRIGIAAIRQGGGAPIVRIPLEDFGLASKSLDWGAEGIVAPMINNVADARRFADACKFPPLGERSWGPTRVLALHGVKGPQVYLETANEDTLAIAMIETRAAQAALDGILAVDGIDGVFVGPSDFSIALSGGAKVDANNADMLKAAAEVAAKTTRAGKVPCTLAITAEAARRARELGFRLIALGSDVLYLTSGSNAIADGARASA